MPDVPPLTAHKSTVDLHSHSTASDGALTPTELVARAAASGVELFALTDHDTVEGLDEAAQAAADHDISLLPGLELSVYWERRTLHIVGLGIDPANEAITAVLEKNQQLRRDRSIRMAQKLEKAGLENALARAEAMAGGQVTRSHFARLLVEAGMVVDAGQAFKRYLKPGKPGYVSAEWVSMEEGVAAIHAAGGRAILAHPFGYGFTASWRRKTLAAFKEVGGDAIEICCGNSTSADIQQGTTDAVRYGFAGSVGADFHGPHQPWLQIGRVADLPKSIEPVWLMDGMAA